MKQKSDVSSAMAIVFALVSVSIHSVLLPSFSLALPLDVNQGMTEFVAVGRPSALKINGKGQGPAGDVQLTKKGDAFLMNAQVRVDLDSMESGISMRDRHMKETYLETGKFKEAVLKFQDTEVAAAALTSGGEVTTTGMLTLHGVEKPVPVSMKFVRTGEKIECESKFKLKLSDFSIGIPRFSGITVADEVQVTAKTSLPQTVLEAK